MRRLRLVLLAIGVAGASLALASCGGGGGKSDLVIGDIIPLTGDLSPFGPPGEKAADVALDQINSARQEVGGDQDIDSVTVKHEDEETKSNAAVSAARKLVDEDATCIAGAWASADTVPVAQSVTIPDEVVQISPASTRGDITTIDDDGYLNRTAPPDVLQAEVLTGVMDDQLGGLDGKTVSVGARNDAYGTGFVDFLVPDLEDAGAKVNDPVVYDTEAPSYDSEAQELVSGSPDAFVIIDFPETFAKVGPALARTGDWDPNKTFITDGLVDTTLPDTAGAEVVNGLRGTAPSTPETGAAVAAFDKVYTQSEPKDVKRQTFDAQNFDAVMLCYLAAVAGGSADGTDIRDNLQDVSGPPGTKYTFEQLPDAITALQDGDDIDYEGASGPVDLDENGDPSAAIYSVNQFQNAQVVPAGKPIPVGSLAK